MKKSLSLLVAIAMVFSMFASVAFAADETTTATEKTTQQKFDELKAAGVFTGYPDGTAGLNNDMTRAEFAKVLAKVADLKDNAAAAKIYTDVVATHWAVGQIGSVTEAGFMNGIAANKFGPTGKVTLEMVAKIATLVAGVSQVDKAVTGTVSPWAKGYVAAAIEAGLLPQVANYQVNATRGLLVDVAYTLSQTSKVAVASSAIVDEKTVEVTFTDGGKATAKLTDALKAGVATKISVDYNGTTYTTEVTLKAPKVTKASQTDGTVITVEFDRPVFAAEKTDLKFDLKKDSIAYTTTATYAADNKSVALKATYLPEGAYTLNVTNNDAATVTVTAEKLSKIEIGASSLQLVDGQKLAISALNQFGGKIAYPTLTVNAYDGTTAAGNNGNLTVNGDYISGYSLDLVDDGAKKDDVVVITVSNPETGTTTTKTFKVADASAISSLKLGTVVPVTGTTRIAAGDTGLILPYEFVDATGNKFTLSGTGLVSDNSVKFGDFQFIVSDKTIVDPASLKVDSNGVLTFTAAKSGTVVITVLNPKAGSNANTTVVIGDAVGVSKVQLTPASSRIVTGEKVKFNYVATDNLGAQIAASQFSKTAYNSKVKFLLGNTTNLKASWNDKGELTLDFDGVPTGANYIYVWVGNSFTQLPVKVEAASYPKTVVGLNDLATLYGVDGTDTVDFDSVSITDNYGRKVTGLPTGYTWNINTSNPSVISKAGNVLTAKAVGTSTITITLNDGTNNLNVLSFTATVLDDSKITSYSIADVGPIRAIDSGNSSAGKYAKEITLVGKTDGKQTVAIKQANYFSVVTSSNNNIVKVDPSNNKFYAVAAGEVTLSVYNGSSKLADTTVKAIVAAPTPVKVAFDNGEITLEHVGNSDTSASLDLYIEDQFGVDLSTLAAQYGVWSSADKNIASVDSTGKITAVGVGTTTIYFTTTSGVSGSVSVEVKAV